MIFRIRLPRPPDAFFSIQSSSAYSLSIPSGCPIKPRVLATAIDFDESTASLDIALSVAPYFELEDTEALRIASEVGKAVRGWRQEAARAGLAAGQIDRMASAFEHDDLRKALDL